MLSRAFTRREKVLITILALLLIFAFYYLVVEVRVGNAIDECQMRIENAEQELSLLGIKKAKLDGMQAELAEIALQKDPVIVPDYDNTQEMMIFLNTVLHQTDNYSINFGSAKMPESGSYIVQRDVEIDFEAPTYETAKNVVEGLQNCRCCSRLTSLSIIPDLSKDAVTDGPVSVSLSMSFYEAKR